MECNIVEASEIEGEENVVIGFDLMSDCSTEEDFFVRNLPVNLQNESASIKIIGNELVVNNAQWDVQRFNNIPQDKLDIIKECLESDETEPHIDIRGFRRIVRIYFINEEIKRKNAQSA